MDETNTYICIGTAIHPSVATLLEMDSTDFSSIGGGDSNLTQTGGVTGAGQYATIPGGRQLVAQSYGQTVVGVYNRKAGTSTEANFSDASHRDQPMFIVGNGTGGATPNGFPPGPNRPCISGSTYSDNNVYAWAHVTATPLNPSGVVVASDFGVSTVQKIAAGTYQVTLNTISPTGGIIRLSNAAIIATVVNDSVCSPCAFINTTPINNGVFTITTLIPPNCIADDHSFMFIVCGRP